MKQRVIPPLLMWALFLITLVLSAVGRLNAADESAPVTETLLEVGNSMLKEVITVMQDDWWSPMYQPTRSIIFSYADDKDAVVFEKGKITINGEEFVDNRQIYEKLAELIGIHHAAMCEQREIK